MKNPPAVLIFSAFDGTGGAGALADGRAVLSAGGLPLSVLTAATAQNLDGVLDFWRMPAQRVRAQFLALKNAPVRAVKIGVLGAPSAAAECLDLLAEAAGKEIPSVWDPVLSPTFGAPFAPARQIGLLKKHILPRAFMLTPNRKELAALSGESGAAAGARRLREGGARFVLAKDVRPGAEVCHELYGEDGRVVWRARCKRRRGEFHGGGCFLSSYLAARLAAGDSPEAAAAAAHQQTLAAIDRARRIPALGRQFLLG